MTDLYKVSPQLQASAAGYVQGGERQLTEQLETINQEFQKVSSTWDADSQAAYLARQTSWNQAGDGISQALNKFNSALMTASSTAADTENRNTSIAGGGG